MSLSDPMEFENLRDAVEKLLIANQGSIFRTIGEQKQSIAAETVKGDLRTIQIYYESGEYPKEKSSYSRIEHDVVFQLQYTVSAASSGDLSVLDNPDSTPAEKAAALAGFDHGTRNANLLLDEFRRIITQILMDPVNKDLGLEKYKVSNRWLSNFRKSSPIDKGNLIILTASERLTATVTEQLIGATPTAAVHPVIDLTAEQKFIDDDTVDSPAVGVQSTP